MPKAIQPVAFGVLFLLCGISFGAEREAIVGEGVLVITPLLSKMSPSDRERSFDLNFFFPKNLKRTEGVITYQCPLITAEYSITSPDGTRRSLNLTQRGDPKISTERAFWLSSKWTQSLDDVGESTSTGKERSQLVWNKPPPTFKDTGEYRLIISGTFRDTNGVGPDIIFHSNEAVWVVDSSVPPLEVLKAKARDAVQKHFVDALPSIRWSIVDSPEGGRTVTATLPSRNTVYVFQFSQDGALMSERHKPWLIE